MTYNYDPKNNKKRFVLYGMAAAAVAAGVVTFFFTQPVAAAVCTAAGVWVAVTILKAVARIHASKIVTYTDGFTVYLSKTEKLPFTWESVTHAGIITGGPQKNTVFAYAEGEDKIVNLLPIFTDFEDFKAELKEHTPWREYELAEGETITAYLKKLLVPQNTPQAETPATESSD